jgi:hypothetical protein
MPSGLTLGFFYRSPAAAAWVAGYGVGYRRGVNDSINGSTRGPDHRLDGGFQLHIPTDVRSDACRILARAIPCPRTYSGKLAKARSRCWAALLVEWGMELTVARACRVPVGLRSGREADRPATAFIPNHLAGMLHAL